MAPLLASSLPAPLSELNEYAHIPLVNIDTFVRRDAATRQAEVEARRSLGDRAPRPSNAFMLYRKCYNARAAAVCKGVMRSRWREEQQSVSAICGMSWQRETAAVTEKFSKWAELEKAGHREAYPDWRYSRAPKKRSKSSKGKEEERRVEECLDAPVNARVSTASAAPAAVADRRFGYVSLDTPFGMRPKMLDDMPPDMPLDMPLEVPYMAHNMPNNKNMPFDVTQNMGYSMAPLPADWRADQIPLPPTTNDFAGSWWSPMPGFQEQPIPQPGFQQQGGQPQCLQEMTIDPAILYPQAYLLFQEQQPAHLNFQASLHQQRQPQYLYPQDDAPQQQHTSSTTNQLSVGEHDVITSMSDERFRHVLGNVLRGSDWDSELAWGLVDNSGA
jgi:hypothetical protein